MTRKDWQQVEQTSQGHTLLNLEHASSQRTSQGAKILPNKRFGHSFSCNHYQFFELLTI